MTDVRLLIGLAPHLPRPPQRTVYVRTECLQMSTPPPPPRIAFRTFPGTREIGARSVRLCPASTPLALCSSYFARFNASALPVIPSASEGSAFLRSGLLPGSLHPARFNFCTVVRFTFCSSTPKATVLLVFPTKSLKILSSGSTVSATSFNKFSRNARRPRLAFSRVSRRTCLSANRPAPVPRVGGRYENE